MNLSWKTRLKDEVPRQIESLRIRHADGPTTNARKRPHILCTAGVGVRLESPFKNLQGAHLLLECLGHVEERIRLERRKWRWRPVRRGGNLEEIDPLHHLRRQIRAQALGQH